MKSTATANQPIACTLIEGEFRDRLAWIAALTRDALRGYERADLTLTLQYARAAVSRVQEMVQGAGLLRISDVRAARTGR